MVCQSPKVARTASMGVAAVVVVDGVVGVLGVTEAAFLVVPHDIKIIAMAMTIKFVMLFFIISLVFYFALQQFVVRILLECLGPLLDGSIFLVVEPQDIAVVL